MQRTLVYCLAGLTVLTAACHAPSAPQLGVGAVGDTPATAAQATLTFAVAWPARTSQTLPLSAQSVRLRVLKGATVLAEATRIRIAQSPTAQATMLLEAASGLTIRAEAFENRTIGVADTPIASAELNDVTLLPNQRRALTLSLIPTLIPTITGIAPSNGGPGVTVTLSGQFGDRDPFSAFLGSFSATVDSAEANKLVVTVPDSATTGAWMVRANGVNSEATGSFQVLRSLELAPQAATASVGDHVVFTVPIGLDTEGATVSAPTLTRWELVDPAALCTSSIGTLDGKGSFAAVSTGTAEVRVFSGSLMATATIRVQ